MEQILKAPLEMIRDCLLEAQVVGHETLKGICGPGAMISDLFHRLTILEVQMTRAYSALFDVISMLRCSEIHALYIRLTHQIICTDLAIANAEGFLNILAIAVFSMLLITLRASWRYSLIP